MSGAAGSRTEFHPLTVGRVEPLTDDSAAVTFDVPPGLSARFAFAPGQSLTVRHGAERRSYSICAAAGQPPRIGVREGHDQRARGRGEFAPDRKRVPNWNVA